MTMGLSADASGVTRCGSQEAAGAGWDCVDTAHKDKFKRYAAAVAEWGPCGIRLQPLVWSNEGRCHPDVDKVIAYCSSVISRHSGAPVQTIARRWRADIGVILAVRRARMAKRCMPPLPARAGWIAFGEAGEMEGGRQQADGELGDYLAG